MEKYFKKFRDNIIGINQSYTASNGKMVKMIYTDWLASGRLYKPIEEKILKEMGPFVANTHTESSETGTLMTYAYKYAHNKVKEHVNAGKDDVIITVGSGMTSAINKLIRILGLQFCGREEEKVRQNIKQSESIDRPVVFITHMEHHSNQTPWLETIAEVVIIPPGKNLLVDPENLKRTIKKYKDRKIKIGSFSASSNVTGIKIPYHELAQIMHEYDGICLVDFAASAPYTDMNMHPEDPNQRLDGIFFSPHKFLGGPGSSGILIFNSSLYKRKVPDQPGGGTVKWTNPWGEHRYFEDIELREDGGTPGFLQAIKAALAIELKEEMGVINIQKREKQLLDKAFLGFLNLPELIILAEESKDRIGCISFYSEKIHYNLIVKLLSDRFGIQVRGGCTCAGTYGHLLLNVSKKTSRSISSKIDRGDLSEKLGWVRLSMHPTMMDEELDRVFFALKEIVKKSDEWGMEYEYSPQKNEFFFKNPQKNKADFIKKWFNLNQK